VLYGTATHPRTGDKDQPHPANADQGMPHDQALIYTNAANSRQRNSSITLATVTIATLLALYCASANLLSFHWSAVLT
jgi:hypothetical protein